MPKSHVGKFVCTEKNNFAWRLSIVKATAHLAPASIPYDVCSILELVRICLIVNIIVEILVTIANLLY